MVMQAYNKAGVYAPFEINDCGVCVNPVEVGRYEYGKNCNEYCNIKVAQFPDGRWHTGYNINYDNQGCEGVCSPCARNGEGHATLMEAVLDRVARMTAGAERRKPSEVVWIKEMLRRAKEQVTELTLF